MNIQHNTQNEDHNRSLVLFSETDNICDYVMSENFDVKDYLSDTLNLDCRETYLTGNILVIVTSMELACILQYNIHHD